MELRQVKAFLVVAREGSITAAARVLHLSQSALSRQIKALEEELGVGLLERGAHSVTPTPAGRLLVEDGARWVEQADRLSARVRQAGVAEVIRVGYAPSLVGSSLGLALAAFSQRHPRVCVELRDASTAEMIAGLRGGDLELIFTVRPEESVSGVEWTPVATRRWRLAMPAEHPLAGRRLVRPGDLAGETLLGYDRRQYPDYWRQVGAYFSQHEVRARLGVEQDSRSSLRMAVAGGMGVALMVGELSDGEGLVFRAIEPEPEPLRVSAGWRKDEPASDALRVLVEELRAVETGV